MFKKNEIKTFESNEQTKSVVIYLCSFFAILLPIYDNSSHYHSAFIYVYIDLQRDTINDEPLSEHESHRNVMNKNYYTKFRYQKINGRLIYKNYT